MKKDLTQQLNCKAAGAGIPARVLLLVLVFLFTYSEAIKHLISTWNSRNDYSHGFLVPFIGLYFIWTEKTRLRRIEAAPNMALGAAAVLFASALLVIGKAGSISILQEASIIFMIPGLVLMVLGTRYAMALALPMSYLVLMIPFLDLFSDGIHLPLQLFSARIAAGLLRLAGIPVFLNAQYIELPGISLEVARECSGINYLLSIIAVGIPLGYYMLKRLWQRIAIVAIAVVIAIIGNGLRVTLIGLWTFAGGKAVHGPLHVFQGFFVSAIGFVSLFIVALIFKKASNDAPGKEEAHAPDGPAVFNARGFKSAWAAAFILLVALNAYLYAFRTGPVRLNEPLESLPKSLGGWRDTGEKSKFAMDGADAELTRVYRSEASGRKVSLYVGYFEKQGQSKKLVHFTLKKFYNNGEKVSLVTAGGRLVEAYGTTLKEDQGYSEALSWFYINGRTVPDILKAKMTSMKDSLTGGRSNGAVILITSELAGPSGAREALAYESDFAMVLLPALEKALP